MYYHLTAPNGVYERAKMKKKFLAMLLSLALFAALFTTASADAVISMGTTPAGQQFNQYIPEADAAVSVAPYDSNGDGIPDYSLPAGLTIEQNLDVANNLYKYYLKGVPTIAGSYVFILCAKYWDGTSILLNCSLSVTPAVPTVNITEDKSCGLGESVTLSCSAYTGDGGTLLYQWYSNTGRSTAGGILIAGATTPSYTVVATSSEDSFYYCVVTNNNNGQISTQYSPVTRVSVATIVSLTISKFPVKQKYEPGEELDPAGLELSASYSNGTVRTITDLSDVTFNPDVFEAVGFQSVLVEYMGKTCAFPVEIAAAKEKVEILRLPNTIKYKVGDTIDTTGLTLRIITKDSYTDVTDGFTCSPKVMTRPGQQTITVIYSNGESAAFNVYVEEVIKEEKLEIASLPVKLSYSVGDSLDTTGLRIKYIKGETSTDLSSGFTCEPSSFTEAGNNQTVTVKYKNLTATFSVSVSEAPDEVTPSPEPSAVVPTIQIDPNGPSGGKPSGSAPTAVVIIAIIIAVAALAGAGTYIYLIKNNRRYEDSEYEDEIYPDEDDDDGDYFVEESAPAAPAPSSTHTAPQSPPPVTGTPHDSIEPEKKDYFEGLFDD